MTKNSITLRQFKTYAIFFNLLFSALLIFSIAYIGVNLNKQVVEAHEQAVINISMSIETFFKEMNDFSLSLSNSGEFKDLAMKTIPAEYRLNKPLGEYFTRMYLIAIKMFEKRYMIGIYLPGSDYIWMGSNYFINSISGIEFKDVLSRYEFGEFKIEVIEKNPFLEESIPNNPYTANDLVKVISLSRILHNRLPLYYGDGLLDVQIPYEEFERQISQVNAESQIQISVYNKKGELLYGNRSDFFEKRLSGKEKIVNKEIKHQKNLIKVTPLLYSNLYMVSSIPSNRLSKSMAVYIAFAAVIFVLLNILLLLVTYKISAKVTEPIKALSRRIEKFSFNSDENEIDALRFFQTDIDELNVLSDTIVKMQEKIRDSMEEIISLRSYEIQSQLLSLQAQMKPHFLYNTLMTIASMAEEGSNDRIPAICGHITNMLRYISSSTAAGVLMAEEISHIRDYVCIMKERFPQTEVEYNIPIELLDLVIPKLVIQPLVENSFKYCDRLNCKINISGCIEGQKWRIAVSDNGIGFSEDKINEIMAKCADSLRNYRLHSLEIEGMGLANIYSRLKIYYGENMIFRIYNNSGEGSTVEIGGLISRDEVRRRLIREG